MKLYHQHSEFYNRPIRLTKKEIKNPKRVIHDFIKGNHLYEIRQRLWSLIETAMITKNYQFEEPRQRDNILFFYEQIEILLEAVYVMNGYERDKENNK